MFFTDSVDDEVARDAGGARRTATRRRGSTRWGSPGSPSGIRATSRPASASSSPPPPSPRPARRVLLLDEPTRGLDPESKRPLARFLRSHAAGGGRSSSRPTMSSWRRRSPRAS